jgi:hypothetical protein
VKGEMGFNDQFALQNPELPLSALGHSLLIRLVSASRDVRSSPKADIRFQRSICSDGPKADSCTAAIDGGLTTSIAGFSPVVDVG